MKKNLFIFLFFLIAFSFDATSQTKFLVSEYRNVSGNTQGEWIELLVIEDNVSIVNYYLRDNSGDGLWMGGVRFKDVPLWRNLRKGTCILIYTRNSSGVTNDLDAEDGFIRLSAENENYFEQVLENAADWGASALNFNQTTECVHLLDNNNNHHHALAQSATNMILTAIATLPYPKVVHQNDNAAAAVRFWGYGGGPYHQVSGSDSTTNVAYGETPGYANLPPNPSITPKNHFYWRSLRQPEWNNPQLTISLVSEGVKLRWSSATDAFPQDRFQGYLILRHLKKDDANAILPQDAYVYSEGQFLGPSVVVANIKGSDITEFIDKNYECDVEYVYRIFAYRYSNTGDDTDNKPERGRGRSYNETNYARAEIITPEAGKVSIKLSIPGKTTFCVGDTITLFANVSAGNFTYQWLNNNVVFSNQKKDTISFVVPGGISRIALKIINEINCSTTSNEIVIEGVEVPKPYLAQIKGKKEERIIKDETIFYCIGDTLKLVGNAVIASSDAQIIWYKDGLPWIVGQKNVSITTSGVYYFEATNKNECGRSSPIITVIFKEYNFDVNPKSLNFVVAKDEDYLEQTITLTNSGNSTLEISQDMLIIPVSYSIVEPNSFPILVPPNKSIQLTIRFAPSDYKLYKGRLIFSTPCNTKFVSVQGYKDAGKSFLSAGDENIDLGKFLFCELPSEIDTTLSITAIGNENIITGAASLSNSVDFVLTANYPSSVKPFESFPINVKLISNQIGTYQTKLYIPYKPETTTTNFDTLKINITAEIYEPIINFDPNISLKIENCNRDTIFTLNLINSSPDRIVLEQFYSSNLQILDLPIEIEPFGSADVSIYFQLNDNIEYLNENLRYEPCSMALPINIVAEYVGIIPVLSSSSVDFGTLYFCQSPVEKEINLQILNYKSPVEIKQIEYQNNLYSLDIQENQFLQETNSIKVRLSSNQIGQHSSVISLVIGDCNDTIRIPVNANLIDLSYALSTNILDFGTVQPGSEELRTFSFTNNSADDIVVSGIDFLDNRFVIISPASFPISLRSGETVSFEIKYVPQDFEEELETFASIQLSSPCQISEIISLKGNSPKKKLTINATLELPQAKVFVEAGKKVKIPVRFYSTGANTLSQGEINSLRFNLVYNPKLLYPETILPSGSIVNNYNNLTIREISTGIAKIEITPKNTNLINDGEICMVEFLGLLGNSFNTNLTLDSVEILSPNDFIISKLNGEVEITSNCLPENRIIDYSAKPEIKMISDNYNSLEIEITKVTDNNSELLIFDLMGNQLMNISGMNNKAGKYRYIIDKNQLASGVYVLTFVEDGVSVSRIINLRK